MVDRPPGKSQRIDKWLFFARLAKSRTLAQTWVEAGHVTVNGQKVRRPSADVRIGDTLELVTSDRDIVVVVKAAGERRGPYEEAKYLYEDISPPRDRLTRFDQAVRAPGAGRPVKKERRELDRLHARRSFDDL